MRATAYILLSLYLLAVSVLAPVAVLGGTEQNANLEINWGDVSAMAIADQPTIFSQVGSVGNYGEAATAELVFDKKAEVQTVTITEGSNPTDEYATTTSKNVAGVVMPANSWAAFNVTYTMPPTKFHYALKGDDVSLWGKFSLHTNYELPLFNYQGIFEWPPSVFVNISLPELQGDWEFLVYAENKSGHRAYPKYYLLDSNSDGKTDEMGWLAPPTSAGELIGQPYVNPSAILNYKFRQVRSDNIYAPFGWYSDWTAGVGFTDYSFFSPLADEGYDDNSSLRLGPYTVYGQSSGLLYSVPFNVTESVEMSFMYKPALCSGTSLQAGVEVIFPPEFNTFDFYPDGGTSDTTNAIHLVSNNVSYSEFDIVDITPVDNGWYNLTASKSYKPENPDAYRIPNGEYRILRVFFYTAYCWDSTTLVDNLVVNAA